MRRLKTVLLTGNGVILRWVSDQSVFVARLDAPMGSIRPAVDNTRRKEEKNVVVVGSSSKSAKALILPRWRWPAGRHLHDNAVAVEVGLGDLGGGVGRHVDCLGFLFFT